MARLNSLGLRTSLTMIGMASIYLAPWTTLHAEDPQAKLLEAARVYFDEYGMPADRRMPWEGTMYFGDPDRPNTWISIDEDDRLRDRGIVSQQTALRSGVGKERFRSLVVVNAAGWQTFAQDNESTLKSIPTIRGYEEFQRTIAKPYNHPVPINLEPT